MLSNNYIAKMQEKKQLPTTDDAYQFESSNVIHVYDAVSSHFSNTRKKAWKHVSEFISTFANNDIVLDIGCGNGKNMLSPEHSKLGRSKNDIKVANFAGPIMLGCDASIELCRIASRSHVGVVTIANCLHLPHADAIFDHIICIAVIHHLSTEERRIDSLLEMSRVLKPGGTALVTVWALEQRYQQNVSQYVKWGDAKYDVNYDSIKATDVKHNDELPIHKGCTQFPQQDVLVPFKIPGAKQEKSLNRFYHVFTEGEFERLFNNSRLKPIARLKSTHWEQGNWCAVFEKQ